MEMLSQLSRSLEQVEEVEVTSDKEVPAVTTCSQKKGRPTRKAVKINRTADACHELKSKEVLVNTQCLLELFKSCSVCLVECRVNIQGDERLFSVVQDCQSCGHHREWKSRPDVPEEPVVASRDPHKDHEQHTNHEKPFLREAEEEHTASYLEVKMKAEPGDEEMKKTCDEEDSPTCSRMKEDPTPKGVKICQTAEVRSALKSYEVLVNTQYLLELFKRCSACLVECRVAVQGNERLFSVVQDCQSCGHHREWKSHPDPAEEPAVVSCDRRKDHEQHTNCEKPFHGEDQEEHPASYPERVVIVPHRLKNKTVPMEIKRIIVSLRNQKKTIREISKTLGLSKSTVWNILQKKASTGDVINKKPPGRPKKTSEEDDQIILSIMTKNPQTPLQQIRKTLKEVGREVSVSTIRRKLHLMKQ